MFDLFLVQTFEDVSEPEVVTDQSVDTEQDLHEVALYLESEIGAL